MIRYTYDLTVTVKVSNIADLYNKVKNEPCVIYLPKQKYFVSDALQVLILDPERTQAQITGQSLLYDTDL